MARSVRIRRRPSSVLMDIGDGDSKSSPYSELPERKEGTRSSAGALLSAAMRWIVLEILRDSPCAILRAQLR